MLTWRTIWCTAYISLVCVALVVGGTCAFARCIFSFFASGVELSCRACCIDYPTVQASVLCTLDVYSLVVGVLLAREASVARLIDTTFGIPSSSIVIMCNVLSIFRNDAMAFGNIFDRYSSVISLDAFWP